MCIFPVSIFTFILFICTKLQLVLFNSETLVDRIMTLCMNICTFNQFLYDRSGVDMRFKVQCDALNSF